MVYKWDKEVDVVIVGFGGAGAAAAIQANDSGCKVVILEKMGEGGGNTACSQGSMAIPDDLAKGIAYLRAVTFGTVDDEELIRAFVESFMDLPKWFIGLGADIRKRNPIGGQPHVYFPTFPGSDCIKGRWAIYPGSSGKALFDFTLEQVKQRKIEVLYEAPVQKLVQDPCTREIRGVIARTKTGDIYIKARKGVALCCGGHENNAEMKNYFNLPGVPIYPNGTPANTGDGLKMVSEIGAKLWHYYCFQFSGFGIKPASEYFKQAIHVHLRSTAPFIHVNKAGKRFQDETMRITHSHESFALLHFSQSMPGYPNIPFFAIFDEKTRQAGPVGRTSGYAGLCNLYKWSKDNQAEIDMGWIVKADAIPDLAEKIGVDPAGLEATVNEYNKYCEVGEDPDQHRSKEALTPIIKPPYYATELCLTMINTMGGAKRNANAQVLDYENKPIPRLYSAGEFGSIFGLIYQGGSNLPEAFAFGRIAGQNLAAEKPWGEMGDQNG